MSEKDQIIKMGALTLAMLIIVAIILLLGRLIMAIVPSKNNISVNQVFSSETKKIDIDLTAVNLVVEKGDTLSVVSDGVSKKFEMSEKDGTLYLKDRNFAIFGTEKMSVVYLTVPSDIELFKLDVGAGKLEMKDLVIDDLYLDQGAGKVEVSNLTVNDADIEGGAGELIIKDSNLNGLALDMGIGKVLIEKTALGDTEIDQGVGELELNLEHEELYKINISKGVGSISINGLNYKKDTSYGNGSKKIDIDGGVGKIIITTN